MNHYDVLPFKRSQSDAMSEVVARAFAEDPVFRYLTPEDEASRLRTIAWLMSRSLFYCEPHNHVYTTAASEGVAAWLPPHQFTSDPWQLLQMIFQLQLYTLPFQCGWDRVWRWLNCLPVLEQCHQQDMADHPHWYLAILAVSPETQGKGIGSALLQPVLSQASQAGLPCYLVTFTEQAVAFYAKHGFVVMRQQKFSSESPPFWTLKHNP
jgi:GNAT superfamily N-acetyltransferase